MRSPLGAQLERAERLATDSRGKRIPRPGDACMRVKETPPHALSTQRVDAWEDDREFYARLTERQRAIVGLLALRISRAVEHRCPLAELPHWQARGWSYARHEAGQALITRTVNEPPSPVDLAAHLGVSLRTIQRDLADIERAKRA